MESANTVKGYLTDGASTFKNNIIAVYTKPFLVDSAGARAVTSGYPANPMSSEDRSAMINEAIGLVKTKAESEGNIVLDTREAVQLTDPFNFNAPNFLPMGGSPAASGANFAGMDGFFTAVSYRGAFGSGNWATGWTNFDPKSSTY